MSTPLDTLHVQVATALCCLADALQAMGLRSVTRLTLIARDPANPQMAVCMTNDTLPEACATALALEHQGTLTPREPS